MYLFLYSAFYFWTKLDITKTVPMIMYFRCGICHTRLARSDYALPTPANRYANLSLSQRARLTCSVWLCSYMSIVSYGFFCLTGTIGFYACYIFVRQIYSAVKVCHAAQQHYPYRLALDLSVT